MDRQTDSSDLIAINPLTPCGNKKVAHSIPFCVTFLLPQGIKGLKAIWTFSHKIKLTFFTANKLEK